MATTDPAIPNRANGSTIDQSWFNVLKTVAEDHEGRIQFLENEFIIFEFNARTRLDHRSLTSNGVAYLTVPQDLLVIEGELQHYVAGTAGTLEADVKYSRAGGSYTSIFSARPTLAYNDADKIGAGTINSLQDELDEGDILRLDLYQLQTELRYWTMRIICQRRLA